MGKFSKTSGFQSFSRLLNCHIKTVLMAGGNFHTLGLAAADDLLTVAQDAHARRYAQETAPGEEADAARCDIIRKTLETNV